MNNSYFNYLPEELLYLTLSYSSFDDIKNFSKGLKLYIDYETLIRINYSEIYKYINILKKIETVELNFEWINLYKEFINDKGNPLDRVYYGDNLLWMDISSNNLLDCINIYRNYPEILKYEWPSNNFTYIFINSEVDYDTIEENDFLALKIDDFFIFLDNLGVYEQYVYIFMYIKENSKILESTIFKNSIFNRINITKNIDSIQPDLSANHINEVYISVLLKEIVKLIK